jgi:hypothetical protein
MTGKINSLNASVAAGIVIYEVVRQKNRRWFYAWIWKWLWIIIFSFRK